MADRERARLAQSADGCGALCCFLLVSFISSSQTVTSSSADRATWRRTSTCTDSGQPRTRAGEHAQATIFNSFFFDTHFRLSLSAHVCTLV